MRDLKLRDMSPRHRLQYLPEFCHNESFEILERCALFLQTMLVVRIRHQQVGSFLRLSLTSVDRADCLPEIFTQQILTR